MAEIDPVKSVLIARVPIAALVAETVELGSAARGLLRGACPSHRDEARGLHVSDREGVYHCYSCGRQGDVVRWMRETARCDERTAIEMLCRRAGLTPPPIGPSDRQRPARRRSSLRHD